MAIKVIKHGNRVQGIINCSRCGCQYSYDEEDIYVLETLKILTQEPYGDCFGISCPECGQETHIY